MSRRWPSALVADHRHHTPEKLGQELIPRPHHSLAVRIDVRGIVHLLMSRLSAASRGQNRNHGQQRSAILRNALRRASLHSSHHQCGPNSKIAELCCMAQSTTIERLATAGRPLVVVHEVTAADSLGSICAHYDADTDLVRRANSIPSTSDYIGSVGRKLRVPTVSIPVMPPLPDEPTRRAGLLHAFALRNGLSNEDAGVFLRIGDWDVDKAQDELDDVATYAIAPPITAQPAHGARKSHSRESFLVSRAGDSSEEAAAAVGSSSLADRDESAAAEEGGRGGELATSSELRQRRPFLRGGAIVVPEGV